MWKNTIQLKNETSTVCTGSLVMYWQVLIIKGVTSSEVIWHSDLACKYLVTC